MIRWFQSTQVDIIDRENIRCSYKNHSSAITKLDVEQMTEGCRVPTNLLLIILIPLSLACLLFVALVLLHHYQWQVKWQIYKTKRKIRLALTKNTENDILLLPVEFDAFIAHDHTDESWVLDDMYTFLAEDRSFNLCLGQKDFVPGTPIAENIAHAINNSRKIVLILTPAFVKSEWCLFEMHMALVVKGKDHIVVILKEEVPVNEMNRALRTILRTITYIEYPADATGMENFWSRVERAISI